MGLCKSLNYSTSAHPRWELINLWRACREKPEHGNKKRRESKRGGERFLHWQLRSVLLFKKNLLGKECSHGVWGLAASAKMLKGRLGFGRSWRNPLNFHLREEKVEDTFSKKGSWLVRLGLPFLVIWVHPRFYYIVPKMLVLFMNRGCEGSVESTLCCRWVRSVSESQRKSWTCVLTRRSIESWVCGWWVLQPWISQTLCARDDLKCLIQSIPVVKRSKTLAFKTMFSALNLEQILLSFSHPHTLVFVLVMVNLIKGAKIALGTNIVLGASLFMF